MREPSTGREAPWTAVLDIALTSGFSRTPQVISWPSSSSQPPLDFLPNQQAMWNTMPGCSDPGIVVSDTYKMVKQAARFANQANVGENACVVGFAIIAGNWGVLRDSLHSRCGDHSENVAGMD